MGDRKDDFQRKLLSTFKVEAEEHVQALIKGLIELEQTGVAEKRKGVVEQVFREAHSLKGAARAVNVTDIEALCQVLENTFATFKSGEKYGSPEWFDALHKAMNELNGFLVSMTDREPALGFRSRIDEVTRNLENILSGAPPLEQQKQSTEAQTETADRSEKSLSTGTVRIPAQKLDSLLYQVEELLTAKLTTRQRSLDLKEFIGGFMEWNKRWAKIRGETRVLQNLLKKNGHNGAFRGSGDGKREVINVLEFLEWNHNFIRSFENKMTIASGAAEQDHRIVGKMVDDLLEDVKEVLMFPFSSLLEMFPKLVRDLSRDRGKDVQLIIEGADIQIDRRILDELKDPLTHLVRNCIDHGVEKPNAREQKKKNPQGTINIAITRRDGSNVEVLLSDDGAGIDFAKVRTAIQKLGLVTREEAKGLSEPELLAFLFQSGVSTSPIITDISGRGLGLAIVREKVEKIGGVVTIETNPGEGTAFRVVVPVTLATFRGILVRAADHLFVLPTANIERVLRVKNEAVKTVENKETISLNGRVLAFVNLGAVLELKSKVKAASDADRLQAIVIASADQRVAFCVDEILSEQEVLVKSLGRQLTRVRNIAGATVLGDGKVVPILNAADLVKSASTVKAVALEPAPEAEVKEEKKHLLVVEDSITARTLLKNILEASGYTVNTAVDGIDALTVLKTDSFDLVVSDVDMPRMNGFDLTGRIRSETKLAEIPVVLVTALESREDRERGIDVGASAYIVKSSFDQSNLLEVIRRLL